MRTASPHRVATVASSASLLAAFLALAVPAPAAAGECRTGAEPAATLLFPYFEVELGNPFGATTLVAMGNRSDSGGLAHVILFTNRGLATYSFDVWLEPNEVRTINLRDIFAGTVPVSGGGALPGCANPLVNPPLGADERARLTLQHTGAPVPPSEDCWGVPEADGMAVGFLTVDVANRCSSTIRTPADAGYFLADGSGVAGNANFLFGDWFLVDDAENSAQGFEALHLVADPARFGDGLLPTFWESGTGERADHRTPLASRYRTRYMNGGGFDGTELLLWTAYPEWLSGEPQACEFTGADPCHSLFVERFDEAGNAATPLLLDDASLGGPISSRLRVGGEALPVETPFGQLEVRNQEILGCFIIPFGTAPQQAFVSPVHAASGQFSVGLSAIATESLCDPVAE